MNKQIFFSKFIAPNFTSSKEGKIRLAYTLAKAGHRNQFRKEIDKHGKHVRYFEHPRRVAIILLEELSQFKWETIVSAFLHDGLEDIPGLTAEMIEKYFGQKVCHMVKLLTKDESNKHSYLQSLSRKASTDILIVKCADRLDNLRTLKFGSKEFQNKQIKETNDWFPAILNKIREAQPEIAKLLQTKMHQAIMSTLAVDS